MTDEFDKLRAALKSATPAPDGVRKAADISAAMAAFDVENAAASQETASGARPSSNRPLFGRVIDGGISMIHAMTSRAGLAATTGLVTAGLAVLLVLPQDIAFGPAPEQPVPAIPAGRGEMASVGLDRETTSEGMIAVEEDADAAVGLADMAAPQAEFAATPAPAASMRQAARSKLSAGAAMNGLALSEAPVDSFRPPLIQSTEAFANEETAGVTAVSEQPVSTFSVDVDTASWSVIRSSLMSGFLPDPDSVRIEEMVNYFPYSYPAPEPGGAPFSPSVNLSQTPWNPDTWILHIALQGEMPALEDRPPLNLVFLIDTSGSMQDANKLPLLKQSLRLMLGQLRPEDQVAIVTYAGSAGQVLAPTPAGDRATILGALDRLEAGGSTAGQAGLEQAYALAESMSGPGELSRILLATDGDFNVGLQDPAALEQFIARKREGGAFLSVLGFGRGNLDDATMQALAQAGNGQAAYIDTISEAQKVLVDQLTGQLFPIAQDVKVQLEFNPAVIAEYRLIGYETRALRREDFANDRIDAGEIGAGHQVTALYEVTPVGSPARLHEDLRYQESGRAAAMADELGFLRLRYKQPGARDSRLIELPIPSEPADASIETRFAIAIAGFGQLLRGAPYLGTWSYADAAALAATARGEDPYGYRAEALRLVRLAGSLAQ